MNYNSIDIVFNEVPNEVSLTFTITGCQLFCSGCHSSYLWDKNNGIELSENNYVSLLNKYNGYITCVLFLGGEWHDELVHFLEIAKQYNLKTCLYTGEDRVSDDTLRNLTFIKTGRFIPALGGLDSINTNQVFMEVGTGIILNHLFRDNNEKYIYKAQS